MTFLLETRDLTKTFGAVVAASEITVILSPGEIVGVIGANGAGKTTFVNMVTGYIKPSKGCILYSGEDITHLTPRMITRKGICRSFQIPQLFLELTALDNIIIAVSIANNERVVLCRPAVNPSILEAATTLLDRFHLGSIAHCPIHTLPQGMRKLVDIAMATVSAPKLLFLDEPTSGVSNDEKISMMDRLMEALQTTDTAVMLIEHDMEIIQRFSPRVIAFYEGGILADGTMTNVFADTRVKEYITGALPVNQTTHTTSYTAL